MLSRYLRQSVIILILALTCPLVAQTPSWQHTTIKDPLSGETTEQFVLTGVYLAPPFPPVQSPPTFEIAPLLGALGLVSPNGPEVPRLVFSCSNGKLVRYYGLLRGLPQSLPGSSSNQLDIVVDGRQKKTAAVPTGADPDRRVVNDRVAYTSFDIGNFLPDILRGETVTLVVRMDTTGNTVYGSAPHQVIMEFTIPNPQSLFDACGTGSFGAPPLMPPPLSSWQHTTIKDPLTEKVVERFVLAGDYLNAPLSRPPPGGPMINDRPKVVLSCSNGKLIRHYVLARGLPISSIGIAGKLDVSIDAGKKKSVPVSFVMNSDPSMNEDRNRTSSFDLNKMLPEILNGKIVTMVARLDFEGRGSISSSSPQVLMEFQFPSPAPILSVCGSDKLLQGAKP